MPLLSAPFTSDAEPMNSSARKMRSRELKDVGRRTTDLDPRGGRCMTDDGRRGACMAVLSTLR